VDDYLGLLGHQLNLIVGDVLHVTDPMIQVVKIALEIITWFNSHAYALAFLQTEQIITYNKSRAIFLPVLTCWLVHYDTTVCLFEIEATVKDLLCLAPRSIDCKGWRCHQARNGSQGTHSDCRQLFLEEVALVSTVNIIISSNSYSLMLIASKTSLSHSPSLIMSHKQVTHGLIM